MNASIELPPATDKAMTLVRGELSSARRWFYRGVLLAASLGLAVVLSLWTTEPGPLPLRLHVAFAGLTLVGVSWIGVTSWILSRRHCPTALDRIATGWVATGACSLFLVMGVTIAAIRGQASDVAGIGLTGILLLSLAVGMLWRAYAERARLRSRLAEFESGRMH